MERGDAPGAHERVRPADPHPFMREIRSELERLGAPHFRVWHPSWSTERSITISRPVPAVAGRGRRREWCEICDPDATVRALRALPDGAGPDAAWDAL